MMKKILLITLILISYNAQSQLNPVLKNKRGLAILPEKGDYSIGIGADPFLNYIGTIFYNTSANNSPSPNFIDNYSFSGKYFIKENQAYRLSFLINTNSRSTEISVLDITPGATQYAQVIDKGQLNNNQFQLNFGKEFRKGKTRLQGFAGFDGFIRFNNTIEKTTYGNKLELYDTGYSRVIERKNSGFTFGIRGFVGAEYFFAPKMSLGFEIGFGPSYNISKDNTYTVESYDFSSNEVKNTEYKGGISTKTFAINRDLFNSTLNLNLFF
jgi:hypothetical protein